MRKLPFAVVCQRIGCHQAMEFIRCILIISSAAIFVGVCKEQNNKQKYAWCPECLWLSYHYLINADLLASCGCAQHILADQIHFQRISAGLRPRSFRTDAGKTLSSHSATTGKEEEHNSSFFFYAPATNCSHWKSAIEKNPWHRPSSNLLPPSLNGNRHTFIPRRLSKDIPFSIAIYSQHFYKNYFNLAGYINASATGPCADFLIFFIQS